ncbi:MAG: hypothetical protein JSV55_13965 [Deltaproteobacteria bacterium]|nr:MAG: hypothetical protein JSV55_13965 [Deltaproteobacteria bacterium]
MDYITCNAKKNRPRVNVAVCAKCRRKKGCPDYRNYCQFPLFPELLEKAGITKEAFIRSSRRVRTKSVPSEILNQPEQLMLDL